MPAKTKQIPGLALKLRETLPWYGGAHFVAQELGLTPSVVRNWACGIVTPPTYWVVRLAHYRGITTDELLCVEPSLTGEARRLDIEDEHAGWVDARQRAGFQYVMRQRLQPQSAKYIRERLKTARDE